MNYFLITILLFVIAILAWLVFVLLKALQKIKLTKERPVSDRLEKAIDYLKTKNKITNDDYQALTKVSHSTATRDLDELEKLGLIKQVGKKGRGVHYILTK